MENNNFNNIFCSRNCQDFTLLFNGFGEYSLYYNDGLKFEFHESKTPKALYKDNKQFMMGYKELMEIHKTDNIGSLANTIKEIIGDAPKNHHRVLAIIQDLTRSLKDAETDYSVNFKHFGNAPTVIIDKAKELSINAGYDVKPFDNLITPTSIDDEIKQRTKPILTSEQKAKATAISKRINEIGLLPFLDNILNNIHIGEHKTIYRKTLTAFKIMRGEASFIVETTSKAETGKSFEDDIVYGLIIPEMYIFEVNDITLASFVRYALIEPNYFNRLIILLGDLGAKKSFDKVEDILNVIKPLITEGKYKYTKSKKDNDTDIIEILLTVESIGAVYQTTKNSFTKDDNQLISRTLYSKPAKVKPIDIASQIYFLNDSKSKQSKARAKAEQDLKDFGLYLLQMVNCDVEIINPYFDVFWEFASKSDNPIREFKQQLELFDAYCILTMNKCKREPSNTLFASIEQLTEYMDFINLENALIPYEYDFLDMIRAKGNQKELTILYNDFDLLDSDGKERKDIDLNLITTLTQCENAAIEQMNDKQQNLDGVYDILETKADLNTKQLKELPQKLLGLYGFRSRGAAQRIFFRYNEITSYYKNRPAYKNIDDVSQLLQTLHNKGYLGKYEYKHNNQNLYYLTPMCENLKTKFKPKKSYDRYVSDYFLNTGYGNY